MGKIIWQPLFGPKYDFRINLDRDFAREMIKAEISPERQRDMNRVASEELKRRIGANWPDPYQFHGSSCFVSHFHIGDNGIWLSTDSQTTDALVKNDRSLSVVEYNSHEVNNAADAHVLMALFDKWIEYSHILKE